MQIQYMKVKIAEQNPKSPKKVKILSLENLDQKSVNEQNFPDTSGISHTVEKMRLPGDYRNLIKIERQKKKEDRWQRSLEKSEILRDGILRVMEERSRDRSEVRPGDSEEIEDAFRKSKHWLMEHKDNIFVSKKNKYKGYGYRIRELTKGIGKGGAKPENILYPKNCVFVCDRLTCTHDKEHLKLHPDHHTEDKGRSKNETKPFGGAGNMFRGSADQTLKSTSG
jgi:hypothetical protein